MHRRRSILAPLLVVAAVALSGCLLGQVHVDLAFCGAGLVAARPSPPSDARPVGHAHNDYEHPHPLADALARRFRSVEADVFWRGGRIIVSHDGRHSKGTLASLYLEPLARRIEANGGSVYGDRRPFYLWIDLKGDEAELLTALAAALDACPFIWRFSDDGEESGAVIVILTGDKAAGRTLVGRPGWRSFVRDTEELDAEEDEIGSPAQRPRAYSLRFGEYLSLDGDGELGPDDRARLHCIVAGAHAAGRLVRLWDAPDTEKLWRAEQSSGVDFINTDDLDGFAAAHFPSP